MKWLQWSTSDLAKGVGGVEVHARCLARELAALGVEPVLSNDPRDLARDDFDVIHLHGSAVRTIPAKNAVKIHTLHGTTFGRMSACGEWLWPGGYAAELREIRGILGANVVLSVRPGLSLFHLAQKLGKVTAICSNGWDAGFGNAELPALVKERLHSKDPVWLYVGRGEDVVKGADRVRDAIRVDPRLSVVAAPGSGFTENDSVLKTGPLDSAQVRELMTMASGLLIPSRYEGHSLVVLEALAAGLVVLGTPVGGIPFLREARGIEILSSGNGREIAVAAERIAISGEFGEERKSLRRIANQTSLPRWKNVAEIALRAVEEYKRKK